MVDARTGFVRFDLAISLEKHLSNMRKGVYPRLNVDVDGDLKIRCEGAPTFKDLKKILDTVGRPYDWDIRKEYNDAASIDHISAKLAQPGSRRYSFWAGKTEIGGAIIANVEPNLKGIFEKAADENAPLDIKPNDAHKTIEIYKIGLFPEFTRKGWGKHLLPMLFQALFEHESSPEVIYLNTRNTNHDGVLGFYTGLNMNVIHARSYTNDLIPRSRLKKTETEIEAQANSNDPIDPQFKIA